MGGRTRRGIVALARVIFFSVAVCRGDSLLSRSGPVAREAGFGHSPSNVFPRGPASVRILANRTKPLGENVGRVPGDHLAQTTSNDAHGLRKPRVNFLFLAVDKISNLEVWTTYFQTAANADAYRAYVHCKTESCKATVEGSPIRLVPTVESSYCTDLVSPMIALVNHALRDEPGDGNPADKFVFLSDSTLPAKPFPLVWATLTARAGSDFCIFPTSQWADVASPDGPMVVPKSLQWVTLTRAHAKEASRLWADRRRHDSVTRLRMDQLDTARRKKNYGCLDEFWFTLALYGPIRRTNRDMASPVNVSNFTGDSLDVSSVGRGSGWQGACDTFVLWGSFLRAGRGNPFERLYSDLDAGSLPNWGTDARPGWWDSLTEAGVKAFRSSEFLFVRKFVDQPELRNSSLTFPQSYNRTVFY